MGGAEITREAKRLLEPRFAASFLFAVVRRNISFGVESERERDADLVPFQLLLRERHVDGVEVERGSLDDVETDLGRLRDRTGAIVVSPGSRPNEGMYAKLVHRSSTEFYRNTAVADARCTANQLRSFTAATMIDRVREKV